LECFCIQQGETVRSCTVVKETVVCGRNSNDLNQDNVRLHKQLFSATFLMMKTVVFMNFQYD